MTSDWPTTFEQARALQIELRERLVLAPPPAFAPRTVAGADVSMERFGTRGYAGIVVLDARTLEMVDQATAVAPLTFPYVPGYLSFRELPPLDLAWERLTVRPDVVVFDAHGTAHPRGFGLACYGGMRWGVPSVGCAKTRLVGEHGPLGRARGATASLRHEGREVGVLLRTRAGVKPVYVSPGNQMDVPTAVSLIMTLTPRYREPETIRQTHRLVNRLRRDDPDR